MEVQHRQGINAWPSGMLAKPSRTVVRPDFFRPPNKCDALYLSVPSWQLSAIVRAQIGAHRIIQESQDPDGKVGLLIKSRLGVRLWSRSFHLRHGHGFGSRPKPGFKFASTSMFIGNSSAAIEFLNLWFDPSSCSSASKDQTFFLFYSLDNDKNMDLLRPDDMWIQKMFIKLVSSGGWFSFPTRGFVNPKYCPRWFVLP